MQRTEEDEPPKLKLIEPTAAALASMMQHVASASVAAQLCGVKSLRGLLRARPAELPSLVAAGAPHRLQVYISFGVHIILVLILASFRFKFIWSSSKMG